jgi:hypothetical protein
MSWYSYGCHAKIDGIHTRGKVASVIDFSYAPQTRSGLAVDCC